MNFKEFVKYVALIVVSSLFTLAVIFWLSITFFSLLIQVVSTGKADQSDKTFIAPHTFIELRLDYPLKEIERDPFSHFDPKTFELRPALSFYQVLQVLDMARTDNRIDGIVVRGDAIQAGWAQTEELRQALTDFSRSGKPVVAYNNILTAKSMYLASAGQKFWAYPMAVTDWKGLAVQMLFFKDLLQKLHIDVQVIRQGKYKSAVEPFTQKKMSPANRLQTRRLVNVIWGEILEKVSSGTGVPADSLELWAQHLTLRRPNDLVRHGLVEAMLYPDQLKKQLADLLGNTTLSDKVHFITETEYYYKNKAKELLSEWSPLSGKTVAVLLAEGQIVPGEGTKDEIGADPLIAQIRKLRKNKKIAAVVLRINSPGGSAMASEQIWRELDLLAQKKPLVVSMGNVAASGGYYIAMAGETIFADRMTITGSIGVFGLVPNFQKLAGSVGINIDTVKTHQHADMGLLRPLDTTEKAYFREIVAFTYHTFLQRVAQNRNLSIRLVDSLGQGRVWTGADALKQGLIDRLGGLNDAINYAKSLAAPDGQPVRIRFYPKVENPFSALLSLKANEIQQTWRYHRLPKPISQAVDLQHKYERLLQNEHLWMIMPYQAEIK